MQPLDRPRRDVRREGEADGEWRSTKCEAALIPRAIDGIIINMHRTGGHQSTPYNGHVSLALFSSLESHGEAFESEEFGLRL